jgi:Fe-S-cluster containining protein
VPGASPIVSPCIGCDARCCRAYTVVVTGTDAFRIARGTGLAMLRFLAYRTQPVPTSTGFLLQRAGPTHDLILKTAPADGGQEPCIFLGDDHGGGRCRIYPLRPDACRRFPAAHGPEGIQVRRNTVCPAGAWTDHPMDRLSWRVALAREQRHAELYSDVVADWNARVDAGAAGSPPTIERYLHHLFEVYEHLSPRGHPGDHSLGNL